MAEQVQHRYQSLKRQLTGTVRRIFISIFSALETILMVFFVFEECEAGDERRRRRERRRRQFDSARNAGIQQDPAVRARRLVAEAC